MIEILGITQHYGVRPVLREVDLSIAGGSVAAIIGPNGMGKTTLLGVMAGVLSPQRGVVRINGFTRRASVDDERAIRRVVTYLPDHPFLPANRTGREFLLGVGRLYGQDDDALFEHVDRLCDLFQLVNESEWPIRSYSNGQKKKIALAAALVTRCPILLLDEPFGGGLDPAGILALQKVLARLGERGETTIVMTAPAPELVDGLARELILLREGRVAAHDTPEGLRRLTGCNGSLTEVVAHMIHPDTLASVERYFEGDAT